MKLYLVFALFPCCILAGEQIDRTVDVSSSEQIKIENQDGNIEIKAWDKRAFSIKGELDDRALGYELEQKSGQTHFRVNMPKSGKYSKPHGSNLVMYVPLQSLIRFNGVNVNVVISEVQGGSRIETINGNIKANDLAGDIRLETVNGNIDGQKLNGDIRYRTVNGNIDDVNSQGELRFDSVNGEIKTQSQARSLKAENVNGEMDLALQQVERVSINTVNGDIVLEVHELMPRARIAIETVSGSASLTLPSDISAKIDVDAHAGGRIKNAFNEVTVKKAKYGPSSSLTIEQAGGDSKIELDTISGHLTLKKR